MIAALIIFYLVGYVFALIITVFNETEYCDETVFGFMTAMFMAIPSWLVFFSEIPSAFEGVNFDTVMFKKRKEK